MKWRKYGSVIGPYGNIFSEYLPDGFLIITIQDINPITPFSHSAYLKEALRSLRENCLTSGSKSIFGLVGTRPHTRPQVVFGLLSPPLARSP